MLLHIYFAGKFAKNFAITLSICIIFMLLIDIIEQLRRFAVSIDYIEIFFPAALKTISSEFRAKDRKVHAELKIMINGKT